VNAVIRPILILLTLPATLLTLGLFIFVINGLLFWFVGSFIDGFTVAGFWPGPKCVQASPATRTHESRSGWNPFLTASFTA